MIPQSYVRVKCADLLKALRILSKVVDNTHPDIFQNFKFDSYKGEISISAANVFSYLTLRIPSLATVIEYYQVQFLINGERLLAALSNFENEEVTIFEFDQKNQRVKFEINGNPIVIDALPFNEQIRLNSYYETPAIESDLNFFKKIIDLSAFTDTDPDSQFYKKCVNLVKAGETVGLYATNNRVLRKIDLYDTGTFTHSFEDLIEEDGDRKKQHTKGSRELAEYLDTFETETVQAVVKDFMRINHRRDLVSALNLRMFQFAPDLINVLKRLNLESTSSPLAIHVTPSNEKRSIKFRFSCHGLPATMYMIGSGDDIPNFFGTIHKSMSGEGLSIPSALVADTIRVAMASAKNKHEVTVRFLLSDTITLEAFEGDSVLISSEIVSDNTASAWNVLPIAAVLPGENLDLALAGSKEAVIKFSERQISILDESTGSMSILRFKPEAINV